MQTRYFLRPHALSVIAPRCLNRNKEQWTIGKEKKEDRLYSARAYRSLDPATGLYVVSGRWFSLV